ncbi:alpha/beta hydrolase family protein [Ningiella sp. W23]|uniref:alpha/beta hydrolase family protein n=1 Tax=Ningiella sp. W23 TaxID=3023715 RepID=UPI003756F80B
MRSIPTTYLFLVLAALILPNTQSLASKPTPADFAAANQYLDVQISPDAKKLSFRMQVNERWRLAVLDLETFKTVGGANLGGQLSVGNYYWASDERIVIEIVNHEPWLDEPAFYGELFAVNYDGSNRELIFGFRAGEQQTGSRMRKKEAVRAWAEVLHTLPDDEDHILISSKPWSSSRGALANVHKLNIHTGMLQKRELRSPIPYESFVTSSSGEILFVSGKDEEDNSRIFSFKDDEWIELTENVGASFRPLVTNDDDTKLYFIDRNNSDKRGLFSLSLDTKENSDDAASTDLDTSSIREIYTDDVVDITDITLSSDGSSAYAIRVDNGYPAYMMFNAKSEEAQIYKSMLATFPGSKVTITSRSRDGNLMVVYVSSDITPGSYYLYDRKNNKLEMLFGNMSHIQQAHLSESRPFTFDASDGMEIHGYITYPVSMKEGDKVPLVTLVHGGPHGPRDWWRFDRQVQMLANEGYAVVQVNFRGSGGYGLNYMQAGYGEWGRRIQQDIIEGTEFVISQGQIDTERMCIMGGSFGGYSAVMSATLEPDMFKCVVANAGVYDLELMYSDGDIKDLLYGKNYLKRAIGNDESLLKTFSPVNHVQKLKAPVLIAHGAKDRRVPVEHAEALRDALDTHNKPYQWFVKPAETHGFYDVGNRTEYYNEVASFLGKHLN